jgi:glycosyltransferase involved in cell wall biosynthesis
MSRVLAIDGSGARFGGGVSRLRELAHSLPLLAPHNRYVFFAGGRIARELSSIGDVTVAPVPFGLRPVPLRLMWQHVWLPRRLSRTGVEAILAPFGVLPMGPGMSRSITRALILSYIGPFSPELSGDLHGYQAVRLNFLRRLMAASLRRADIVFFLSNEGRRLAEPYLRRSRVVVLPMAPPPPATLEAARATKIPAPFRGRPYFVVVGDLLPHKGIEDALQAMPAARRAGMDVRLIICGQPFNREYAAQLQRMAAPEGDRIVFAGSVPQRLTLALMASSIATVICSRLENTSRVPAEAMAVGSPLIVTDIPNHRDVCGDAAVYYSVGNHAALADLMKELQSGAHRRHLVEAGQARIETVDWMSASRTILETIGLM